LLPAILKLQLALPVTFAGKLPTSALGDSDVDTRGMEYANWYFKPKQPERSVQQKR